MSKFQSQPTEISIYMDDLYVTKVSIPDEGSCAIDGEAQISNFEMILFTVDEWMEISKLIAKAIKDLTGKS